MTNQKRTASVVLRMTDSEKETLQKQAENKHITLSNYLRLLIFENQK